MTLGGVRKQKLGVKAPLCRVHHCACPSNPRATCKIRKSLPKDDKSLGGLGKFSCELLLTEAQVWQHTLKFLKWEGTLWGPKHPLRVTPGIVVSKQPAGVGTGSGAQDLPVLPAREKEKKQIFGAGVPH